MGLPPIANADFMGGMGLPPIANADFIGGMGLPPIVNCAAGAGDIPIAVVAHSWLLLPFVAKVLRSVTPASTTSMAKNIATVFLFIRLSSKEILSGPLGVPLEVEPRLCYYGSQVTFYTTLAFRN
jgi:hypothetical protein